MMTISSYIISLDFSSRLTFLIVIGSVVTRASPQDSYNSTSDSYFLLLASVKQSNVSDTLLVVDCIG